MSPADEKDPKDAPEETPDATEAKAKPKPKRKPAANTQKTSSSGTGKTPAKSAAEVEKEVSEEAAKSVPRADADAEDAPAPAEESSEAAAVEASVAEEKTQQPGKKRRKKADDDAPKAEDTQRPSASSTGKPAKDTPARKRDQPRTRQAGEAPVLVSAKARYVRTSARKARLVCDHIRGKDVEQARAILSFTPRGAAKPWMKLLESAIANAEHNHELVGDELKIASVHADEGPTLKRYRPRAMGRATRIRKRTSHLSITLTPKE
jgi:large subunit ribosomal protein L22